jgi:hypothetical protein
MGLENELGKIVARMVEAFLENSPEAGDVKDLLKKGDWVADKKKIEEVKGIIAASNPINKLSGAIGEKYSPEDGKKIRELMAAGNYPGVLNCLTSIIMKKMSNNPYCDDPLNVANILCGSKITYTTAELTRQAVISQTFAWSKIGGADQTIPNSEPGTIGTWYSAKYGGFYVPLISAHNADETGAVSIRALRQLDGQSQAEINSLADIVNDFGFNAPIVNKKSILDQNVPLQITPRKLKDQIKIKGYVFEVRHKPADKKNLGGYILTKII